MNASLQPRTTIGHLVFPILPALNLERLLADLDEALAGHDLKDRRLSRERDDLAQVDVGSVRIVLALTQDLDGTGGALVTIAVGFVPEADDDTPHARRQAVLARMIADHISARFVPTETTWSHSDAAATPALVGQITAALAGQRRHVLDAKVKRARAQWATPRHFLEPNELPRMLAKLESILSARRLDITDILLSPDDMDIPPLDISDPTGGAALLDVRDGVASPMPNARLRLAAHMIDATLMVVALPVGAAMMTYSLTRGADLHTSARAMAVCGIGIGLLQNIGGLHGLEALLAQVI